MRVTDVAPAGLVPAAWVVAAAADASLVAERTLFVALLVMSGALVAFLLVGWGAMTDPVLSVWRWVIVAGVPVTLAGVAGLRLDSTLLLSTSLLGWMLLPGAGYLLTARRTTDGVYAAAGVCSLAGAVVYWLGTVAVVPGVGTLAGLALVGVGQTAGMVRATLQNVATG
jgi:hypothetical protein